MSWDYFISEVTTYEDMLLWQCVQTIDIIAQHVQVKVAFWVQNVN